MTTAKSDPGEVHVDKWAAIEGKWKFKNGHAQYLGPSSEGARMPIGLAKASARFRDGSVCSRMKLSRNERTTAGIFIRFQSLDAPFCLAQIGAYDRAYAISEYQPGGGFIGRAVAGSLSNLNTNETHEFKVTVVGQLIRLVVDDVEVLSTTLSTPMEGTGFGLYAYDDAQVDFIHGASSKLRIRLRTNRNDVPNSVIVKGGFEAHSRVMRDMHANEVNAYRWVVPTASTMPI